MSLKSSIMSKLAQQMSGQEFDKTFLFSKHVLKVYFKPSRKNKAFIFLPDAILPGWLKILHLREYVVVYLWQWKWFNPVSGGWIVIANEHWEFCILQFL